MPSSQLTFHPQRGLEELLLEAMASSQLPAARPSDSDVSIEVVFDDDDLDLAVTSRFVRFSAPYERVEIESIPSLAAIRPRKRATTFVRTVAAKAAAVQAQSPNAAATLSFDKVWFDQPEETFAAIEEPSPAARANSWLWLGISLLAGALAVGAMFYAL